MEDVDILRNLGTPPDVMERYVEERNHSEKSILYLLDAIIISLFVILVFIILFWIGIINVFVGMLYITIVLSLLLLPIEIYFILNGKPKEDYTKLRDSEKKCWLIWAAGVISNPNLVYMSLYIIALEASLVIIIAAYFTGDTYMALFSLIFLLLIPIGKISSKKAKEMGFTIERLFPGDVDEIAKKIEKALGREKIMVIKYKNSRSYKINFKSQSNLKLYVSRHPERKEFTTVGIMGVKNENLSEVVKLISRINKILT